MLQLQIGVVQDVHAPLAVGEKEKVTAIVPRDFIHLEAELFLGSDFVGARVDESDQVLLVAGCNRLAIGRPRYVDVLPLRVDYRGALARADVPDPHRFVATGRAEQVRCGVVPADLIDGAAVSLEGLTLAQTVLVQCEDGDGLVEGSAGQSTTVAVPAHRVHLGGGKWTGIRENQNVIVIESHWNRTLAECAFCSFVLLWPLKKSRSSSTFLVTISAGRTGQSTGSGKTGECKQTKQTGEYSTVGPCEQQQQTRSDVHCYFKTCGAKDTICDRLNPAPIREIMQ